MPHSTLPLHVAPLPRWLAPALLGIVVLFFGLRNLPWHLDDYDQAKQAYVSFEMRQEGHWWYQHTPTDRAATKPPLAGWISAVLAAATGDRLWEAAWRLPPLACAVLLLWLLFRTGTGIGGEAGGLLAAGAFGLNLISPHLASLVRTDMLLCLWIYLIGALIFRKLRREEPWSGRERWMLFALLLASFWTKGPIAYAFLLPGLVAFWWLQRRSPSPAQAWSGWWSWGMPLLFFIVWAGVGIWQSHDFYEDVVLQEFLGRFQAGQGAPHRSQPIYFYLAHLLLRFFPWSLALAAAAAAPEFRMRVRRDPALLWLVCWALGGLLIMSLIPSKRPDRIFPILPPLCLLLAAAVPILASHPVFPVTRRILLTLLGIGVVYGGSYMAHSVVTGYRTHQGALRDFAAEARRKTENRSLAAINGKDEGLLLYLGLTHFTRAKTALAEWRAGTLQACVMPWEIYRQAPLDWAPARVISRSGRIRNKLSEYVLLERGDEGNELR